MNQTYHNEGLGGMFSTLAALVWPSGGGSHPLHRGRSHVDSGRSTRSPRPMATLRTWQERVRQRLELSSLDDHILQDVGLTREQVEAEIRKPFWRA